MLNILLFSFVIMYTPGPVNLMSFNNGLQNSLLTQLPFSLGVGCSLGAYFILIGYVGDTVINERMLPYIGILGSCFIIFLAYKILTANVAPTDAKRDSRALTFKDGVLLQLLNPKSFLVVLPVATIQFPAAGITGIKIVLWSALLGMLGFGAPTAYAGAGAIAGQHIADPKYLKLFNTGMGLLLVFVALDMIYHQVYLPLSK